MTNYYRVASACVNGQETVKFAHNNNNGIYTLNVCIEMHKRRQFWTHIGTRRGKSP